MRVPVHRCGGAKEEPATILLSHDDHALPRTFLGNLPLFRELAPEQLDRMATHTRQVRAPRGEILFHRGDEVHGFHVIIYGQIKLAFISAGGDEKVVEILGPGSELRRGGDVHAPAARGDRAGARGFDAALRRARRGVR